MAEGRTLSKGALDPHWEERHSSIQQNKTGGIDARRVPEERKCKLSLASGQPGAASLCADPSGMTCIYFCLPRVSRGDVIIIHCGAPKVPHLPTCLPLSPTPRSRAVAWESPQQAVSQRQLSSLAPKPSTGESPPLLPSRSSCQEEIQGKLQPSAHASPSGDRGSKSRHKRPVWSFLCRRPPPAEALPDRLLLLHLF